jgi:serine/threonine-protein phosphatase CPPED1
MMIAEIQRTKMKFIHHFSFRKISWLAVVWFVLSGCAASKQKTTSFYFIQMSDPQFGFFNENKSFEKETENFRKAIRAANRLKPAFVVITGDLVNRSLDSVQIAEYKRVSQELDSRIPLYNVAGNHDVGNTPTTQSLAAYKKAFGADYYSFTYESALGIVLNSMYLKDPQLVPEKAKAQEDWLVKTLEKAKKHRYTHIFVFLHHPLFLKEADEADQYFNIPLAARKKYLALFKASGIQFVFAGHYHRNAFGKDGDLNMVTTGPVGKPLGRDSSGFRIITVKGNTISYPYYSLDSLPARVRF